MALGYEGYVKIGDMYLLGTGSSAPRARARLDSSSGYGGIVSGMPMSSLGIGAPRAYDWDVYDGSINFEYHNGAVAGMWWLVTTIRDTPQDIVIYTRNGSVQEYSGEAFWTSISASASEGAVVDGSFEFSAFNRSSYDYGNKGIQGYYDNKGGFEATPGVSLVCDSEFPLPLNKSPRNNFPVPFWNTKITLDSVVYDFISWNCSMSQDVVKFHSCNNTVGPQGPAYVGIGPMTGTLSGAWMWVDTDKPTTFPSDNISVARLDIGVGQSRWDFKKLERSNVADDIQSPGSLVPINMEYSIYEVVYGM